MVPRRDLPTPGMRHKGAMRVALLEVMRGGEFNCGQGWGLFLLLLRLVLVSSSMREKQLEDRLRLPFKPVVRVVGKQRVQRSGGPPNLIPERRRPQRERYTCGLSTFSGSDGRGELSAARGVLEALPVALGTMATLWPN